MTMTSKVKPYKARLRPVRARGLPRAGAVPVPRDLVRRRDRGARAPLQGRRRPVDGRVRRARARAGRGRASSRCRPTTRRGCRSSAASTGSSGSTTRCSRASGAPGRCGRSSTTRRRAGPDSSSGKSIGGGLPLAGVTGGAEVMDAVPPGGLGGTFGGNPLSCAAALAVLDDRRASRSSSPARASSASTLRARLDDIAARARRTIGEVRGLGPMLAFELAERTPDRAKAVVDAAFERGLLLLSCGLYGNVDPPAAPAQRSPTTSSTRGSPSWRSRLAALTRATPDISVSGLTQALRRRRRGRRRRPRHPARASSSRMLGPSGSGKTTTLRMIAGLRAPDEGTIELARRGRLAAAAVRPRRQHRLPGLRALPAHDRAGRTSSTGSW